MINFSGVVIGINELDEKGRFLKILTEKRGVLEIFSRGAKKPTSKNNPSTELFAYAEFCVNDQSGRLYLDSSKPLHIFEYLRTDLKALSLAVYCAEILLFCSETHCDDKCSSNPEILHLMLRTLHYIDSGKRSLPLCKSVFELRLCSLIGFMPALIGCRECLKYDGDNNEMYFLAKSGILMCEQCFDENFTETDTDFILSPALLHTIRHICLSDNEKYFAFKISEKIQNELSLISETYLFLHMNLYKNFKPLLYYNSL
ncbi:MAG: DNA repair protein RecO [Ruminococcus sp.]|jgi:DNA repair protein RecO (recombination protein O)|nr:DNA repair protein RecO [Ruminococcus sp.]